MCVNCFFVMTEKKTRSCDFCSSLICPSLVLLLLLLLLMLLTMYFVGSSSCLSLFYVGKASK